VNEIFFLGMNWEKKAHGRIYLVIPKEMQYIMILEIYFLFECIWFILNFAS